MGVSVSETAAEMPIAMVSVMANSCRSLPSRPPMKMSGMNTAISEMLIDSTVNPIWRDPLMAAASGRSPRSR